MSDAVRKAFAAWVEREMGPDDGVCWGSCAGYPTPPWIEQDGRESSLEAEFDAFQAGYSLIDQALESERDRLRGLLDELAESVGEHFDPPEGRRKTWPVRVYLAHRAALSREVGDE